MIMTQTGPIAETIRGKKGRLIGWYLWYPQVVSKTPITQEACSGFVDARTKEIGGYERTNS
jgi:hypothetical protein